MKSRNAAGTLIVLVVSWAAAFTLFAAGQQTGGAGEGVEITPPGAAPIVEGGQVTITAFMSLSGRADTYDYGKNAFSTWFTDTTNVKYDFITAPGTDAKTKVNLLLNSGDYPEVIFKQLSSAEMSLYGSEGVLIPLESLMEKWGSDINKVFDEYPVARDVCTGVDGHMYAMPSVNDCYHCAHNGRLWVYNPWMQEMGMGIPETTEEFRDYLRAVKNNDPNGNGKADEIPLAGAHGGGSGDMTRLDWYFLNSFTVFTPDNHIRRNNGKIEVCYMDDGYQRGLEYLNSLYEEGLILQEAFSIDNDGLRKIGENPDAVLMAACPGHGPGDFVKKAGPSGRWWHYLTIPPLKGPDGTRNAFYRGQYSAVGPGYFITDKCTHPEVAFRAGEMFYDPEVLLRAYQGPLGETWEWAEEGEKGIHGEQALYKLLTTYGAQEMNLMWDQANHDFRSSWFRLSEEAPNSTRIIEYLDKRNPEWAEEMHDYNDYNEVFKYYLSATNYHPYVYDQKNLVPPLIYDDKDYAMIADLEAVILPYVDEMFARFIIGDVDLDTDWDSYIRELQNMHIDQYLELLQKTYDRKYK